MVNNTRQFLYEYGLIIKNDINNYYEKMKRGLDDLIAVKIKEAKEKDLIFQKENAGNDFLHKKRKSERNVNIDDKKKNKVVKLKIILKVNQK